VNERDLEQLARQLGAREAMRVDPEQTAAAVLGRLRSERIGQRPVWARAGLLRTAAAAALVVAAGLFALRDRIRVDTSRGESLAGAVQGLETLEAEELVEVLDSLVIVAPVTSLATTTFDDLTVPQLEALLEQLEG